MFKQNFIKLCNERRESPSHVCREVGIAPATFSCWTDESVPRKATLMRIADYFGVTAESLTEETVVKKESAAETVLKKLNIDQMDDEELLKLAEYAEFLISQRKKKE